MVSFTFIRHGESTDNLRRVWAGWKDAPLSNHGMKQAQALAASFAAISLKFTAVHSSPLKRALTTAQALCSQDTHLHHDQVKSPLIPIESLLLRERHFGAAEGKSYTTARDPTLSLSEHFALDKYPSLHKRTDKFPDGESQVDLAQRAERAVQEILLPYIWTAVDRDEGDIPDDVNVAVVSHGMFISEIVVALLGMDESCAGKVPKEEVRRPEGLANTGWHRIVVDVLDKGKVASNSGDGNKQLPPLRVRMTDSNRHEHLDTLIRQKGGIGSASHDPKQKDIRNFFGGGSSTSTKPTIGGLKRPRPSGDQMSSPSPSKSSKRRITG